MTTTSLEVRRYLQASPERVFRAWTSPAALQSWWGPKHVACPVAEVDLRKGGQYRLVNRFPDGTEIVISGEFVRIERPRELVYTWSVVGQPQDAELVTVTFTANGEGCDVLVLHEKIPDETTRNEHEGGWEGCLEGLIAHICLENSA